MPHLPQPARGGRSFSAGRVTRRPMKAHTDMPVAPVKAAVSASDSGLIAEVALQTSDASES